MSKLSDYNIIYTPEQLANWVLTNQPFTTKLPVILDQLHPRIIEAIKKAIEQYEQHKDA